MRCSSQKPPVKTWSDTPTRGVALEEGLKRTSDEKFDGPCLVGRDPVAGHTDVLAHVLAVDTCQVEARTMEDGSCKTSLLSLPRSKISGVMEDVTQEAAYGGHSRGSGSPSSPNVCLQTHNNDEATRFPQMKNEEPPKPVAPL